MFAIKDLCEFLEVKNVYIVLWLALLPHSREVLVWMHWQAGAFLVELIFGCSGLFPSTVQRCTHLFNWGF